METQNLTITLFGQTRTIGVHVQELDFGSRAHSSYGAFICRIGQGAKRHSTSMHFAPVDGPGRNIGQTEDGRFWEARFGTAVLNRQARIVGWNDDAVTSRHSGERL